MRTQTMALFTLVLLSGCVANRYRVGTEELTRMASEPPEQRGQRVRAAQVFAGRHEPGRSRASGTFAPNTQSGGRVFGAFVILTAPITVPALILSEAGRFDGYVGVAASHRLHLFRKTSIQSLQWRTTTVGELTEADATWADGGILERPWMSPSFELERAPLERTGFALSLDGALGGTFLEGLDTSLTFAGGVRLSAGYFPHALVGAMATLETTGSDQGRDLRVGAELQLFAPAIDRLSFGVWAGGGFRRARRDPLGFELRSGYGELGAIVQYDLTTHAALQVRGGTWAASGSWFPTFAVGLSVY